MPVRVLMVGNHPKVKGGITTVLNEYKTFNDENIIINFLYTYKYKKIIMKLLYFSLAILKLFVLLLFKHIDIVHIHMSYKGSFSRKKLISKICLMFRKKIILHLHGSEFKKFYEESSKKDCIKKLLESVDCVIVLGKEWEDYIKTISSNIKVYIINNCVKKHDFRIKPNNLTFTFSGVLIKRKGVIDFLKALNDLDRDMLSKIKVNIIGTGSEEQMLKKFCLDNSMNFIKFWGWLSSDALNEVLMNTTYFVLPSYNEGLPMSILEAMSFGIPVISTKVGSIPEAIKDNYNGFLYEAGDINRLKSILIEIIELKTDTDKLSNNSYSYFLNNFEVGIFYTRNAELYYSILKK